jgi:hypothetical protein
MDYRVDEKGKVFTDRVSKLEILVTVRVDDAIIQGTLHVSSDNRLKDELNNNERFIALTQAQVWTLNGTNPIYSTEVLLINKTRINWIFPREESSMNQETTT